jgi:hypothetical protein
VQVSPRAKSLSGSRVKTVVPVVAVAVWLPLVEHEIENQEPVRLTGSLKVMSMFEARATLFAPFAGVVDETEGAASVASGVREKSSTARPSSEPAGSKSIQRIQKAEPAAIEAGTVAATAVRFAAAFPSSATAAAPSVIGEEKSSASASVHVPVVRLVASVLIWKSRRSARPVVAQAVQPNRHCSPA